MAPDKNGKGSKGSKGYVPREAITDERFTAANTSKTFKNVNKNKHKIVLDERFKSVLTDDKFRANPGAVDKYGRSLHKESREKAAEKELREFYQVSFRVTIV